jgi:metal-dependent HD superfamily phosphatase/phosphodiesterase
MMTNFESGEINKIYALLDQLGFRLAKAHFHYLMKNQILDALLREADFQTRGRFINRHDKKHAIVTVRHAIEIFNILRSKGQLNIIPFSLTDKRRGDVFDTWDPISIEEYMLIAIIISSFCHDVGRSYHKDHAEQSWSLSRPYIEEMLKNYYQPLQSTMLILIQQCIKEHEATRPQEFGEQGIVTIADCIDNSKNRIQPDETDVDAILYDPNPIEFFSCKEIESISLSEGLDKPIRIEYRTTGNAAVYQIRLARQKIKNTKLKDVVEIYTFLPNTQNSIRIWPLRKGRI